MKDQGDSVDRPIDGPARENEWLGRPFLLRRPKEDVVAELPPKTEIVERVEMAGTQRDLYESIRLSMRSTRWLMKTAA